MDISFRLEDLTTEELDTLKILLDQIIKSNKEVRKQYNG